MLYHRPQGSSTPGKAVLLWRQVNVLANYAGSNYEYTFWAHWKAYNENWLYLDTFPFTQYASPLPQGFSAPDKTVLPWRQVSVLATYTTADHEYTLSEYTAVADGVGWLYLDTLSPMEDALPWTADLFHTWKTTSATNTSQNGRWQTSSLLTWCQSQLSLLVKAD